MYFRRLRFTFTIDVKICTTLCDKIFSTLYELKY